MENVIGVLSITSFLNDQEIKKNTNRQVKESDYFDPIIIAIQMSKQLTNFQILAL
jgi:hypothetical protein